MRTRMINLELEYDKFAKWWTTRNLPNVPKDMLPFETGIVVESAGVEMVVGWMYLHGSRIGLVDWVTTNPAMATSSDLTAAVKLLLDYFKERADSIGCKTLFSLVAKETGLHRLMVRDGWADPKSDPHVYLYRQLP